MALNWLLAWDHVTDLSNEPTLIVVTPSENDFHDCYGWAWHQGTWHQVRRLLGIWASVRSEIRPNHVTAVGELAQALHEFAGAEQA